MRAVSSLLTAFVLLNLSACATAPSAQVVRFHTNQPLGRGEILVRPRQPNLQNSLEFQIQAKAVAEQLSAHGYRLANPNTLAPLIAEVDLSTQERDGAPKRSGFSIGLGGGFSTGGVGLGTGVSIPIGSRAPEKLYTTTLSVTIRDVQRNQPIWEGRSSLETKGNDMQGTAIASALAQTLFADFPGVSGKSLNVPIGRK